jgi:hypothetical protein
MAESKRFQGYGWSRQYIENAMQKSLTRHMEKVSQTLQNCLPTTK